MPLHQLGVFVRGVWLGRWFGHVRCAIAAKDASGLRVDEQLTLSNACWPMIWLCQIGSCLRDPSSLLTSTRRVLCRCG